MKRLLQIFVCLALILGCATQESELIGTYKSDDPGLVRKAWKFVFEDYEHFVTGTELELKSDSSFCMVTCGNILTGQWYNTGDSLYLIYETNRWRNDSLRKNGFEGRQPQVNGTPEAILIKGNSLVFNWKGSKENSENKVYDVLEK